MKQFLPFLTDDQGRSLDTENAVVLTRSMPTPLDQSPEGWESNTIQFARNNEFRGLIISYTTSLKFYLEGARILRDAFYRKGVTAVLYFIWLKLNQTFGAGMTHESWYKGEIDFGTFKDEWDGVTVNIAEGGFHKDLQANKAVIQEIPFDEDAVSLYSDGMIFYNTVRHSLYGFVEEIYSGQAIAFNDENTIPFLLTEQEGTSYGLMFLSVSTLPTPHDPLGDYVTTSNNWMVKNGGTIPISFNLAGHIDINVTFSDEGHIRMFFISSKGLGTIYEITPEVAVSASVGRYVFPYNFDITLDPGESLFPIRRLDGLDKMFISYEETSENIITSETRAPASVIRTYRVFDLFNKLTAKVSNGATLSGSLLQSDYNLLVTSGDAIRALPNAVIKTSFSDCHKSVDAVKCIALDVVNNNPVIYSRYDKFNKNSTIADLGECTNWTLEPAQDYIYDSVNVGYPSKAVDSNIDLNGKYSFNNTFVWKVNKTIFPVNSYDAVSKYYADPYDIELIRLNLNGKNTTTGSTDNSNFFIDAELKTDVSFTELLHFYSADNKIVFSLPDGDLLKYFAIGSKFTVTGTVNNNQIVTITDVLIDGFSVSLTVSQLISTSEDVTATMAAYNLYQLRRVDTVVSGVPDDGTVFNIGLSPKRILANHYRWLRSSFDHLDASKLIFQTTEKNKDLVSTDPGGNLIDEKADVSINGMGEKVYLPYYTSFDIQSPYDLLGLVTANNFGKFNYTMNGIEMDGFIVDIKTMDATLETQNYKLLQSANCENKRLINGR